MDDGTPRRKGEHIEIASSQDVSGRRSAGFEDVAFVGSAVPELDMTDLDTSVTLLGHRLRLPLVISSMTGGHPDGARVNQLLARAAQRHGIAMGVGSQRAALRDPGLVDSYAVTRREAPDTFLIANIGAAQLVEQGGEAPLVLEDVERCIEMIHADALAIHLNALQELVQPEGQTNTRGWLAAIDAITGALSLPVIAKETGAGMDRRAAVSLAAAGVAALDVGGAGGTSFAAVEAIRATRMGLHARAALGAVFRDWGTPTIVSVVEAATTGLPVIATGGIRRGDQAARALGLGATAVGVARPLLEAVLGGGEEAVDAWIAAFEMELRATMYLTGSRTVADLAGAPLIVSGATGEWLSQLGHMAGLRVRLS